MQSGYDNKIYYIFFIFFCYYIIEFTRIDFTKTNSAKINSGYLEEYVSRTVKGTEYAGQGDQKAGEICRAYIWQKTNRKNIADLRGS